MDKTMSDLNDRCQTCDHERRYHYKDGDGNKGCHKCHCLGFLQ